MNTRIVLVTHNNIGQELLTAVASMIDINQINIHSISIPSDIEASQLAKYKHIVKEALKQNNDENTLILCDVYGATPYNLVKGFTKATHTSLLTGLNLGMLLKAVQITKKPLKDITQQACQSAQNSIIIE